LPTANHVFLPGHRMMVQVRSTWFRLSGRRASLNCLWSRKLAPRHPMGHALASGGIRFVVSIAAAMSQWNTVPTWYHVASLALVMPSAAVGGWLRA
jgi:hypothetical protein